MLCMYILSAEQCGAARTRKDSRELADPHKDSHKDWSRVNPGASAVNPGAATVNPGASTVNPGAAYMVRTRRMLRGITSTATL